MFLVFTPNPITLICPEFGAWTPEGCAFVRGPAVGGLLVKSTNLVKIRRLMDGLEELLETFYNSNQFWHKICALCPRV